jgi:hypothetical protein
VSRYLDCADGEGGSPGWEMNLIMREWAECDPCYELRSFVCRRRLTALSQCVMIVTTMMMMMMMMMMVMRVVFMMMIIVISPVSYLGNIRELWAGTARWSSTRTLRGMPSAWHGPSNDTTRRRWVPRCWRISVPSDYCGVRPVHAVFGRHSQRGIGSFRCLPLCEQVLGALPYEHCVIDFVVRGEGDALVVTLIEINPFSPTTGASLFDWNSHRRSVAHTK